MKKWPRQRPPAPRGPDQEEMLLIDQSLAHPAHQVPDRSTRHHRVDHEFLGLLNEDFGIDFYSLNQAFMGVPPAPKRQAISLCEWAMKAARGDVEEAGRALRAWAKKNGKGLCDKRFVEAPEI